MSYMQTRPSVIRVNNCCVKRKTLWNCLLFAAVVLLLLCMKADILLAMLAAGAVLLLVKLWCIKK